MLLGVESFNNVVLKAQELVSCLMVRSECGLPVGDLFVLFQPCAQSTDKQSFEYFSDYTCQCDRPVARWLREVFLRFGEWANGGVFPSLGVISGVP